MQCRSVLSRIDAMRTGELASHEHEPMTDHLQHCPSCEESVEDVELLARTVKALTATPPRSCRETVCNEISDSFASIAEGGETVWIAFNDKGLRMIHRGGSFDDLRARYARTHGRALKEAKLPEKFRKQVQAALHGEGVDKPQVDWGDAVTDVERDVLNVLTTIPKGEVRTYAWVARQAGRPSAVRAVGNICARNIVPFVVPCHRVVPSSGGIGNYAFGSALKRELLRREGVDVDTLEALAKKGVRFVGSTNTKIFCFPTCGGAIRIHEENRVPFHSIEDALKKGFRPCRKCQPYAAAS